MATKNTTELVVPGADNTNQIPQGQNVSIFIRGLDAFTAINSGKVMVKGKEGDAVEATVVGTKAGRLFSLASELMSQAPGAIIATQRPGGYNFLDVAFFSSLTDAYGKGSTEALEPYTVVVVMVPMQPVSPASMSPTPATVPAGTTTA